MFCWRKKLQLVAAVAGLFLVACSETSSIFTDDGRYEKKPDPAQLRAELNRPGDDGDVAAKVNYHLKVTSRSGATLCDGDVELEILTNFTIEVPDVAIKCIAISLNLHGLLLGGGTSSNVDGGELIHDGKVLSTNRIAGADFSPPRPLLIGPIIQDRSIFKNFEQKSNHKMRFINKTTGLEEIDKGSFLVRVIDHDAELSLPGVDQDFSELIHWEILAEGFEKAPAVSGVILERVEWYWNTRPLMIPKLTIEGKIGKYINDGDLSKLSDELVGTLKIEITATKIDWEE